MCHLFRVRAMIHEPWAMSHQPSAMSNKNAGFHKNQNVFWNNKRKKWLTDFFWSFAMVLHSICNWWKIQVRQPSPSRPFLISLMFLMHIVFRVFLYIYFSCFLWWVVALCVSDSCGGFLCSDNIRCVVLTCFFICSSWLKPGEHIKFTEELSSMLFR